jgi:hypothetical protein
MWIGAISSGAFACTLPPPNTASFAAAPSYHPPPVVARSPCHQHRDVDHEVAPGNQINSRNATTSPQHPSACSLEVQPQPQMARPSQ